LLPERPQKRLKGLAPETKEPSIAMAVFSRGRQFVSMVKEAA
jgi:hypothetical protein